MSEEKKGKKFIFETCALFCSINFHLPLAISLTKKKRQEKSCARRGDGVKALTPICVALMNVIEVFMIMKIYSVNSTLKEIKNVYFICIFMRFGLSPLLDRH